MHSSANTQMDGSTSTSHELDDLVAFAYQELRAIAHGRLAARGGNGTLSTTALVHEAYLKLADQSPSKWRDRSHFFAVASLAMRHVLVDRAKARHALMELDDVDLRSIMARSIDTYYYSDEASIQAKLALGGRALLDETALPLAGLIAGIDTHPEGK